MEERRASSGPRADQEAKAWGKPRLRVANREQVMFFDASLDELIAAEHPVRAVWDLVVGLDLSAYCEAVLSVEGEAGRPAADPRILLALWIWATLEGVGSARALDQLCREHVVYRWLAGGVSLNYHTLADFRSRHPERLDALLTQSVAVLLEQELVSLKTVVQDGCRTRASAGSSSFRRRSTLEQHLQAAKTQVEALKTELEDDPSSTSRRVASARTRAAQERIERIEQALARLPQEEKRKAEQHQKHPPHSGASEKQTAARVSTTDPEARVMKMADGGFRPAYNVQFASDPDSQIILGVAVTSEGNDAGQMPPMVEQLQERYGQLPEVYLVDSGFASHDALVAVDRQAPTMQVYAPVPEPRSRKYGRFDKRPGDKPAVVQWRQRMASDAAPMIYRRRSLGECVHALARQRGLVQLPLRGLRKVHAVALLMALAHNVWRSLTLQPSRAVAA